MEGGGLGYIGVHMCEQKMLESVSLFYSIIKCLMHFIVFRSLKMLIFEKRVFLKKYRELRGSNSM